MGDLVLIHEGVGHDDNPPGRGSGRYGWGTGENPGQHQYDFLSEVDKLRKKGIKPADIAKMLLGEKGRKKDGTPIWATTTDLKAEITIETKKKRKANMARAAELYEKYGNYSEVGRKMGINESTVRSLLDPIKAERTDKYESTANMLRQVVDEKGIVDISSQSEYSLGVNKNVKDVAVAMLEKEGYIKTWVQIDQLGTTHKTNIKVIAKKLPGESDLEAYKRIQQNKLDIQQIQDYTPDNGKTWWTPKYPQSLDSDRVYIRYAEDGGTEKDGVIELRRNVEDISLGGSQYAQVRVMVDDKYYMKGMAMYADDVPKGYDIIYNTNKSKDTPKEKVFKKVKTIEGTDEIDRDNPFGALIKRGGQREYIDENGEKKLSPINKMREEGDWDTWSKTLSSQFLSKQSLKIINQQLDLSVKDRRAELDEILKLTNPVIKKKMLEDFSNNCDATAADLNAVGFKNQKYQVLLPVTDMKDNEIYAPNYKDGDIVALVRFPHGGIFEIPVLKVNNRQATAKRVMGGAADAVGINLKVADQLSGADFDGDTAMVIPVKSNRLAIQTREPLEGLKNFDHKSIYKLPDDAPEMKSKTKQNEMGKVSNLITDMTVGGANWNEIEKAVKHSMVVIDAEKHHLDYKQSAKDNDIIALKKTYQGTNANGQAKGASTILSKAGSEVRIPERREITDTSKMTPEELNRWNEGKRVYRNTGATKIERISDPNKMTPEELKIYKAGKKVYRDSGKLREQTIDAMYTVDDAVDLVRNKNNPKEMAYAKYANELKSMANEARREYRAIKPTKVDPNAKKTYAKEVESLNASLRVALSNAPRERQAQAIGNAIVSERFAANPGWDYEHKKRERQRALTEARAMVGASKTKVQISDKEWEAIQANALSTDTLTKILNNTDQEAFKKRATPRGSYGEFTPSQIALMKSMSNSGMYTQKEIAEKFGVSASTISKLLKN